MMNDDDSEILLSPNHQKDSSQQQQQDVDDDISGARFPIIEQPTRCLLVAGTNTIISSTASNAPPLRYLTCYKNGTVTTTNRHHGPKQEFLLIPDTTERGLVCIKNVKFNTFVGVSTSKEERGGGIVAGLEQETTTNSTSSSENNQQPTLQSSETTIPYKWLMIKSSEKGVMFQSLEHPECTIGCDDVEGNVCSTGTTTTWHIEFLTGELLFMSESSNMGRVRCDLVGSLSLSENWKGWEVWRMIETTGDDDGAVRINSWMHSQFYLCINGEGNLTTCTLHQALSKPDEYATKWVIQKAENDKEGVWIRNADCGDNDKMLSVNTQDGSVCAVSIESSSAVSNTWQLEAAHLQQYTMVCSGVVKDEQKQLSLGPFPYVTPNLRQSDEWKVLQLTDGSVALFSQKAQQYLAYGGANDENEGAEIYLAEKKSAGAHWLMEPFATEGGGGFVFRTKTDSTNNYLSFQEAPGEKDGKLCISSEPTIWTMDPCLPRAVSSAKIKTFAIGTSLAVGTTIAMPFALAGVGAILGAVGAEVGLFANIIFAGLTGAEAIASAGVIAGTAALVFRESGDSFHSGSEDDNEDDAKDSTFSNRPFCAWRTWK